MQKMRKTQLLEVVSSWLNLSFLASSKRSLTVKNINNKNTKQIKNKKNNHKKKKKKKNRGKHNNVAPKQDEGFEKD